MFYFITVNSLFFLLERRRLRYRLLINTSQRCVRSSSKLCSAMCPARRLFSMAASYIPTFQHLHASSIRASPEPYLLLRSFSFWVFWSRTSTLQWSLRMICMHGAQLPSLFPGENKTSVGQPFYSAKRERSTKSHVSCACLNRALFYSPHHLLPH